MTKHWYLMSWGCGQIEKNPKLVSYSYSCVTVYFSDNKATSCCVNTLTALSLKWLKAIQSQTFIHLFTKATSGRGYQCSARWSEATTIHVNTHTLMEGPLGALCSRCCTCPWARDWQHTCKILLPESGIKPPTFHSGRHVSPLQPQLFDQFLIPEFNQEICSYRGDKNT